MEEYVIVETNRHIVKNTYEFFTYKDKWDEVKTKLNITDEELRDKVEQCLQMWAWADILEDVLDMEKYKEKLTK